MCGDIGAGAPPEAAYEMVEQDGSVIILTLFVRPIVARDSLRGPSVTDGKVKAGNPPFYPAASGMS